MSRDRIEARGPAASPRTRPGRILLAAVLVVAAWLVLVLLLFPHPLDLFYSNWSLILVGFGAAIVGNSTAVGGGLVFIPAAIFFYRFTPITALKLSLGSQAIGMTSGALAWARHGAVPFHALWVTVPALTLGSSLGTLLIRPSAPVIKGLFGPVSILVGLLILATLDRRGQEDDLPRGSALPLGVVAMLGGALTGWVAVGEGEVVAAFLMLVYGVRPDRGIALGVTLLSINSIYLTLLHQFFLGGIPWNLVLFTGIGCIFGARLGPVLGRSVGPRRLKQFFAVVAMVDGCLFLFQALR